MTAAVMARLVPVNNADLIPEANVDEEFASLNLNFLDYNAQMSKFGSRYDFSHRPRQAAILN